MAEAAASSAFDSLGRALEPLCSKYISVSHTPGGKALG